MKEEITFEMAVELGLIRDDSLERAYRSVEGDSILSKQTNECFEVAFIRNKETLLANNTAVNFNGELLKVI